jgi:HSP20 family protein
MASAFMSNPFAFAQAMSQEMDRLFEATSSGGIGSPMGHHESGLQAARGMTASSARGMQQAGMAGGRGMAHWAPQMEVMQRGNELVISADLPGLTPDDVQLQVEDGMLTISGERRQSGEERQDGFYRSERSYGSFSRSIALPEGVDEDQVNARFEHGVLEVSVPLPQQQRRRGRRVQIQSGGAMGAAQSAGQGSQQQNSQGSEANAQPRQA